ncbi:MAG: hypothetical protein B6242_03295 [Anaerolineaceae bacterium 4572_78]|nr:MAG: hypothetical protein B6242_03295 [Anaerolineaceae bacterium 4572_78]
MNQENVSNINNAKSNLTGSSSESSNPIAKRMIRRFNWRQSSLPASTTTETDSPSRPTGQPRQTAFSVRHTQRFINHHTTLARRSLIWHPNPGLIQPALFTNFAGNIINRYHRKNSFQLKPLGSGSKSPELVLAETPSLQFSDDMTYAHNSATPGYPTYSSLPPSLSLTASVPSERPKNVPPPPDEQPTGPSPFALEYQKAREKKKDKPAKPKKKWRVITHTQEQIDKKKESGVRSQELGNVISDDFVETVHADEIEPAPIKSSLQNWTCRVRLINS